MRRSKLGKKCAQPNMTSNSKRTASDRFLYEEEKKKRRERFKMMRNATNTDRTSKERDIRGTRENDWKQKTKNKKLWNKICDKV